MGILVNAYQLRKSFATRPLFDGLTFSIESGDRVGLIGPNGMGKSTLLRILAGKDTADSGTLSLERGLRIGFLEQVPLFLEKATIQSTILESSLDSHSWNEIQRALELMSKLGLSKDAETPITSLSGGWKKRVALARELMKTPDLFLLDEPTNHLDVESILWLEELLARASFATLTITHDRLFLQRISNRIIELDRRNAGGLLSVKGDYTAYLEVKELKMAEQAVQETRLKNTLRRETEWLRRGPKARTTKQNARIKRAGILEDQVDELEYRNRNSQVQIDFQLAEKNPKKLVEAEHICKSYSEKQVIPSLNLLITQKARIGLLGPNGCGKSTLLRILTGRELPDTGTIRLSENLLVASFEQNRESLDLSLTPIKTLCPSGDHVHYRGASLHVKGYLDRFLFTPEQMVMPVEKLSGGEQARLLIAKLMLKEANLLVLDEPTNDLDIATLNILQDVLQDFPGAIILVTHDRYFLDQVATQILVFHSNEKDEKEIISFHGLEQWESWHKDLQKNEKNTSSNETAKLPEKKRKLTFKEQKELESMEENILSKEASLEQLTLKSSLPENATNASRLAVITREMATTQEEIDFLYTRWAELEKFKSV